MIFQDFVRYHLPVSENIGFGQIEAADRMDKIVESARKSGADAMIEDLTRRLSDSCSAAGFTAATSCRSDNGSASRWRAPSCATRRYLVLDEPTASLDAQTEYEIFQHFKELTAGKMAILISHRFSTVRMADRIVVIQGGQIVEIGSHEELLRMEGTYARLFSMQAEGYR